MIEIQKKKIVVILITFYFHRTVYISGQMKHLVFQHRFACNLETEVAIVLIRKAGMGRCPFMASSQCSITFLACRLYIYIYIYIYIYVCVCVCVCVREREREREIERERESDKELTHTHIYMCVYIYIYIYIYIRLWLQNIKIEFDILRQK